VHESRDLVNGKHLPAEQACGDSGYRQPEGRVVLDEVARSPKHRSHPHAGLSVVVVKQVRNGSDVCLIGSRAARPGRGASRRPGSRDGRGYGPHPLPVPYNGARTDVREAGQPEVPMRGLTAILTRSLGTAEAVLATASASATGDVAVITDTP